VSTTPENEKIIEFFDILFEMLLGCSLHIMIFSF
jgi:hypothetical protein